jgi:proteasome lid subunit RPN8/RPN11
MFRLSIHDEVILLGNGIKIESADDKKKLKNLGISDGDSLFIGVCTPPLPLESVSFYVVKNIKIKDEILEKCFKHAGEYPNVEVAGALIGKEIDGAISVVDSVPTAEGTPTSVILDPAKIANIANNLRSSDDYIIGWYHSHVKTEYSMSSIDARLQNGYQKLYANAVALILNPIMGTREFYRVHTFSSHRPIGKKLLNLPEPKLINMDSESVTLITILEEKEEAEIMAFSGSDTTCGSNAIFSVTVKNVGTVPFSKARVILHVTSPDGKASTSTSSDDINLLPGASETCTLQCTIPVSWPSGNAMARAGVRNTVTRSWLCSLATASITLIQPPLYRIKLKVFRTSQQVRKGQAAIYTIFVMNEGNRQDTIEVDWDLAQFPKSWTAKIYDGRNEKKPPFSIGLDAGAIHRLVLEVIPIEMGYVGNKAPVTIKVRSLSQ